MDEVAPEEFDARMKSNLSQTDAPAKPEVLSPETGESDAALKQAIAQEERRMSRHRGKSIKRPARVARSMAT